MHYAPCFNCDVNKAACPRRIGLRTALTGLCITSLKFKCAERKAKFEPGQRVAFNWTWFDGADDEEGLPMEFYGTVLRENGAKFVVQVDHGKDAGGENIDASSVFKKNDQLLIKVRPAHMRAIDELARVVCPTCYLVEGVAEDRCYRNDYFPNPRGCKVGALVRSRIEPAAPAPATSLVEIEEGYF